MLRSLVVLSIILTLGAARAPGQDGNPARAPHVDFRLQLGFLPLYGGDATVGGVHTWLPSVGVGYWLPLGNRRTMLEASVAHVGPNNQAPALTFWGLVAHGALREPTAPGPQILLQLGIGRLRIDDEEVVCEPPTCFAEGGPSFVDGTFTTGVGGVGFVLSLRPRLALRADVRLYLPLNASVSDADSGDLRSELAAGIVLRL